MKALLRGALIAWPLLAGTAVLATACHRAARPEDLPEVVPLGCDPVIAWDTTRPLPPSARVALLVPEFGGAFGEADGTLAAYLTDMGAGERVRTVIDSLAIQSWRGRTIRFMPGRYSYRQLREWAYCLRPNLSGPGIASLLIAERENRLRMVVVDEAAWARVEAIIRKLSIPRDAVMLEKGGYVQPTPGA